MHLHKFVLRASNPRVISKFRCSLETTRNISRHAHIQAAELVAQHTAALRAYCERKDGLPYAMHMMQRMAADGIPPSTVEFECVMRHAVVVMKSIHVADAVWDHVVDEGIAISPGLLHYRVIGFLLDFDYCKAVDTLKCPSPGVVPAMDSWVEVLKHMLKHQPDNVLVDEILSYLTSARSTHAANEPFVLELCMEAHLQRRRPHQALKVFSVMKHRQLEITQFGYNAALFAWAQISRRQADTFVHKTMSSVADILSEMASKGIKFNETSFNHYLAILCHSGHITEAAQIPTQMLEAGVTPQAHTYATLISAFCDHGKLEEAFTIFERYPNVDRVVNAHLIGALLKPFAAFPPSAPEDAIQNHVRRVLLLIDNDPAMQNDVVYNILVRGYILRHQLPAARLLFRRREAEAGHSLPAIRAIVFSLLDSGYLDKTIKALDEFADDLDREMLSSCSVKGISRLCNDLLAADDKWAAEAADASFHWRSSLPTLSSAPDSLVSLHDATFLSGLPHVPMYGRPPPRRSDLVRSLQCFAALARMVGSGRDISDPALTVCKAHGVGLGMPRMEAERTLHAYPELLRKLKNLR